MSAHCSEVLAPAPDPRGVKALRIVERVEGFVLQRFDDRGEFLGDDRFDTLDEPMRHVYAEYDDVADWRLCPEVDE
jgi:hypothetical protein